MPYQWNQQSGEWEWTDTGPNYGLGRGATEPTLAHGIDPWQDVGLERLYGMAARAAFPSLESSDLHQRLVSRLQDPLMGQYQMSFPAAGRSEEGFQKWLMGEDGVEDGSRFYGQQGVPGVARPEWEQMINVARTYGQGRPEALESIGIDPRDAQSAYDRWYETGPLGVDESVRNILGLATFDPRAGSIYGRMRQAGLQRAQNRFFAENPFATNVDWLGHLTGQEALVNRDYYVGSTPTIPSEVAANGAPTGVVPTGVVPTDNGVPTGNVWQPTDPSLAATGYETIPTNQPTVPVVPPNTPTILTPAQVAALTGTGKDTRDTEVGANNVFNTAPVVGVDTPFTPAPTITYTPTIPPAPSQAITSGTYPSDNGVPTGNVWQPTDPSLAATGYEPILTNQPTNGGYITRPAPPPGIAPALTPEEEEELRALGIPYTPFTPAPPSPTTPFIPEPFIPNQPADWERLPNPTFNQPADWEYLDPSLEGTGMIW